jgi:hypothetical protein
MRCIEVYNLTTMEFILRNENNSTRSLPCLLSSSSRSYLRQFLCNLQADKSVHMLFSCTRTPIKWDTYMCGAGVQYSSCRQAHLLENFALHSLLLSSDTFISCGQGIRHYSSPHACLTMPTIHFSGGEAVAISKGYNIFHFH